MDEILFELRERSSGLNAGRWDCIFSTIKTFRDSLDYLLPNRADVTMTVPFMRAYTELLVRTCHKRGTFAMGVMAALIPAAMTRPPTSERWTPCARTRHERPAMGSLQFGAKVVPASGTHGTRAKAGSPSETKKGPQLRAFPRRARRDSNP